ncbi:MAG TPA: nucleotidyltransferase family protein [Verrucomicrobiae bacterium]|nr:nucleotidyltransferase family protein [Verrucomicrobiae bacterium]
MKLAAMILGAGRSRRMGRPKLLLPWAGTTVLGHLLKVWRGLEAEPICVVVAADDHVLSTELDRLGVPQAHRILNPSPETGMFGSVQCAAGWAVGFRSPITHIALILGDQPHLKVDSLSGLLRFSEAHLHQVCQPSYRGHKRHPVIVPRCCFEELAGSSAQTLKEFLADCDIGILPCDDPGLDLDLDTPLDYQKLLLLQG